MAKYTIPELLHLDSPPCPNYNIFSNTFRLYLLLHLTIMMLIRFRRIRNIMPPHNQPIIQRPKPILYRRRRLINEIIPINLKLILVGLAILQHKFDKALIAVLQWVVLLRHLPLGLPVVPVAEDADVAAD